MNLLELKLSRANMPYLILAILLACCAIVIFISLLNFKNRSVTLEPASPYVQGYSLKSRLYGVVRIIPITGAAFTCPVPNTADAVLSPYMEMEENIKERENSSIY